MRIDELFFKPKQSVQTTTQKPEQQKLKSWFGASVVKDKAGNPLKVFHGTPGKIDNDFRPSKNGVFGPGIYFTTDAAAASKYAAGTRRTGDGEAEVQGSVYPVYLKIQKPLTAFLS